MICLEPLVYPIALVWIFVLYFVFKEGLEGVVLRAKVFLSDICFLSGYKTRVIQCKSGQSGALGYVVLFIISISDGAIIIL